MARFSYTARTRSAALVSGQIDSKDRSKVADWLLQRGLTPVQIREQPADSGWRRRLRLWAEGPLRPEDLVFFCRQLQAIMRGGVPINQGVRALAEAARHSLMREALYDCSRQLEEGRALSAAMATHADIFSAVMVNLVRVGEETGRLEQALAELQKDLESEQLTRRQIKSTMRYPIMVIVAVAFAFVAVNLFVIPAFSQVFANFNAELPLITRGLMATSAWVQAWWQIVAGGLFAAWLAGRQAMREERFQLAWGKLSMRLPLVGEILLKATLARVCRMLAMCARSGVVLDRALGIVGGATGNRWFARQLGEMREGLASGESLNLAARRSGLFTQLVLQMISTGEETGSLEDMLDEAAGFYEREVAWEVSQLSEYMEPVLLVVVSLLVLLLALGIFLPMWDIAQVTISR